MCKCEQCPTEFEPNMPWQRYCSNRCRMRGFRQRERLESLRPEHRKLIDVIKSMAPRTATELERLIAVEGSRNVELLIRLVGSALMEKSAPLAA